MKKVRIISGTYGQRDGNRITPKDRNSDPFLLEDTETARLVSLGVAEIVGETVETSAGGRGSDVPNVDPPKDAVDEDAEGYTGRPSYSIETSANDLRKIAKEVGITFKVGTTKEDMIAVLDEYFDGIPDLTAEVPVG